MGMIRSCKLVTQNLWYLLKFAAPSGRLAKRNGGGALFISVS